MFCKHLTRWNSFKYWGSIRFGEVLSVFVFVLPWKSCNPDFRNRFVRMTWRPCNNGAEAMSPWHSYKASTPFRQGEYGFSNHPLTKYNEATTATTCISTNAYEFLSDSLQWVTLISHKYSVSPRLCVPI